MLFRACNLEDARPAIDIITFSINYRYSKLAYDDLCNIIAKDMGQLQMRKNKAGNLCKYIPTYKVTLEMPSQTLHGWGRIYFTPTQVNLSKLQEWLWKFVAGDVEAMQNKVKLSRCELAYDFYIPGSGYVAHEGLAKRLWWYIWPINGRNLYASYMTKNLHKMWFWPEKYENEMCFCNFNDVLIHYGKQDDGAVNGDFTGYIQVCKRALKQYSAHSLNPNSRASKHTTIYPKAIDEVWQTRIEMELAKSAIKKMKFKNTDFAGLLDNLPKFSDLYELREVDITTFTKRILSMPKSEPLRSYTWQKRIEEAENMPTADKIRMMRNMADVVENKKLKNNILKKYTRLMSFEEAINRRLGSTASPSRRMEKRKKPDNSAFKEALPMLIHIGNKRHEVLPVLGCS